MPGEFITTDDASGGGTWSSGTTAVATVGTTTGIVFGITPGTSIITYTSSEGCTVSETITVNPVPVIIAGPHTLCTGTSVTLTDGVGGGVWSSSATLIATVGSITGIVTGNAAGISTITYELPGGCYVTATVMASPAPIAGPTSLCEGATITLTEVVAGGTWSSGNTAVATVGTFTGVVTGVSPGTATIVYTTATGCTASTVVTVNLMPVAITGPLTLCSGSTVTLTDGTPGGTWSSGATAVATVGVLTGVVSGF